VLAKEGSAITVKGMDGKTYQPTVVKAFSAEDGFVILKAPNAGKGVVELDHYSGVKTTLWCVGSAPDAQKLEMVSGAVRETKGAFLELTIPSRPSDVGGPLVDDKGKVVAMLLPPKPREVSLKDGKLVYGRTPPSATKTAVSVAAIKPYQTGARAGSNLTIAEASDRHFVNRLSPLVLATDDFIGKSMTKALAVRLTFQHHWKATPSTETVTRRSVRAEQTNYVAIAKDTVYDVQKTEAKVEEDRYAITGGEVEDLRQVQGVCAAVKKILAAPELKDASATTTVGSLVKDLDRLVAGMDSYSRSYLGVEGLPGREALKRLEEVERLRRSVSEDQTRYATRLWQIRQAAAKSHPTPGAAK